MAVAIPLALWLCGVAIGALVVHHWHTKQRRRIKRWFDALPRIPGLPPVRTYRLTTGRRSWARPDRDLEHLRTGITWDPPPRP